MSINTTKYLSTLPDTALVTLAKRWQSTQKSIAMATMLWLAAIVYLVLNKDSLLPNANQFNEQNQAVLSDFVPAISIFLGALAVFIIILIIVMMKTLKVVRELAAANNVPFKPLLKESKQHQHLLKKYL